MAALQIERIGLLVERHDMLGAIARHDDKSVEGVDPLGPHQMPGKGRKAGDVVAGAMGNPVAPGGLRRDRRFGNRKLEVHGPIGVGPYDPAVGPVVQAVLDPDLARFGDRGRGGRVVGGDQQDFGGLLIAHVDQDVTVV